MDLIVWVCLVIAMTFISLAYVLAAFNHLGKYTIGGAHNSVVTRIGMVCGFGVVAIAWTLLVNSAPFTIVLHAG